MAVAHYLEALQWQKEIIKIHTIFGGRTRTPTTWWAAWLAPSTCRATAPSTWSGSTMCAASSPRPCASWKGYTSPTSWRWRRSTPSGPDRRRPGKLHVYGDIPQNGIAPVEVPVPARHHSQSRPLESSARGSHRHEPGPRGSRAFLVRLPAGKDALHPWEGVTEPHYSGPKPPYGSSTKTASTPGSRRRAGRAMPWR